jgi:hypothetical protein
MNRCEEIHKIFNNLKRYYYPFDINNIPKNGIYIMFEKNEKSHGMDRIVRIGTHTGKDQLRSRLHQHFINENKDRSIFRKNIGRALLNKSKDPIIIEWEIDMTPAEARQKFVVDKIRLSQVEKQVSEYIQKNISFVTIQVNDKNTRLDFESKIISTLSNCKECRPSKNWLGLFSTKEKIRESGLWQVNELNKKELSDADMLLLNKFR